MIKQIDKRHENQLIVRSLLGVCNGSKTQVIAVGVENKEEWQVLQSLGVDGAQGRLFESEQPLNPSRTTVIEKQIKPGKRNRWRTK